MPAYGIMVLMATTTMNISLPDALRAFVEEEVSERGYASASEYVRELVRERKAKKDLEGRLLAALDDDDLGEFGAEFFDELRDKVRRKARRGGK